MPLGAQHGGGARCPGGTAVDAAIAAITVAMATEPGVVSALGGAFVTIWPAHGTPEDSTPRARQHLLGAEALDIRCSPGPLLASDHGVGSTQYTLNTAAEGKHDGTDERRHYHAVGRSRLEQPTGARGVLEVRQHSTAKALLPVNRQTEPDQGKPDSTHESQHHSDPGECGHRSTRSSSASRPSRSMSQYASAVTSAPTNRTSAPVGVA